MLISKKTHNQYSKTQKQQNQIIKFGNYGLQSYKFIRMTKTKKLFICALLIKSLKKSIGYKVKFWNYLTLNQNLTKLSSESRMGKGKGIVYTQANFIVPGTIIFEFELNQKQQLLKIKDFFKKNFTELTIKSQLHN